MSDVFDWANEPKLSEKIEEKVAVGDGDAYISGSWFYNSQTKNGKVTLVLNLSLVTMDETNAEQIMVKVKTTARKYYDRLRDARVSHHNYLNGQRPGQLRIDDAGSSSSSTSGEGGEDEAPPSLPGVRRRQRKSESGAEAKAAAAQDKPKGTRKRKAKEPEPATEGVTVTAE